MKSASGTGINCDSCGRESKLEFVYYSIDFKQIEVVNNKAIAPAIQVPIMLSLDNCQDCFKALTAAVGRNYKNVPGAICCDLCGVLLRGSFVFYQAAVTYVKVSMAGGRLQCRKCSMVMPDDQKPCSKCGSLAVRVADLKLDKDYLQLAVCDGDYQKVSERALAVRKTTIETQKG